MRARWLGTALSVRVISTSGGQLGPGQHLAGLVMQFDIVVLLRPVVTKEEQQPPTPFHSGHPGLVSLREHCRRPNKRVLRQDRRARHPIGGLVLQRCTAVCSTKVDDCRHFLGSSVPVTVDVEIGRLFEGPRRLCSPENATPPAQLVPTYRNKDVGQYARGTRGG